MTVSPIRLAMVGAGKMAREHSLAFRDVPGVKMAGLYSRTRDRADSLARDIPFEQVFNSIDELYDRTHADLLVVAVNMLDMFSVASAALVYPWTILLEKPAGADLREAEELAAASREHRKVYVALNRRHYASTIAALEDVSSRTDPRYIHVADQQDQAAGAAMGHPPRVVANWMFGNSIHLVDYLRLFGRGAVRSVEPFVAWDAAKPWMVSAKVSFESGDVGIYEGVWSGPGPWAVTVQTAARRWEMRPLERAVYQNRGERTLHEVPPDAMDTRFKPGFRRQAQEAVAAALGRPSRLATIEDSLESMRLVSAIFKEWA